MKPLHGLKQAVGDYQKNHRDHLCIIYLDTNDSEVWTKVCNEGIVNTWSHNKAIHALNTHIQDATGDIKVTTASVRRTAEYVRRLYADREDS
jgi:hypothetical protein